MTRPAVLFVCLGNICRSPMAEGALRAATNAAGLDITIDSCGTAGYHVGEPPDPRAIAFAGTRGADISDLRARQLEQADFERFTYILAADHANLANIERAAPAEHSARVALIMDMVPGREGAAIADPYYGGEENFADTWEDVSMAAAALVERLSG